jgi:hypothetical protein
MQILETFQQFLERNSKLFEQSSEQGFIVSFGCTDVNNVLGAVAQKLGIEADFEFTGSISGAEGFDNIAQERSFAKVLKKGKAVPKGKDFLEIKANGKTYTLNEKGSIQVPFSQGVGPVFEVRGSGNGLLSLMRAIQYFRVACEGGFDNSSPFDGTLFIQIGLPVGTRKGKYIAVNAKYTASNSQRTGSDQYLKMLNRYLETFKPKGSKKVKEGMDLIKIQEQKEETAVDQILVCADSIADAIKGAHFIMLKKQWKSKFSAYQGYNKMNAREKELQDIELTFKDDTEKATYYLAVAIQTIMDNLKYYYPLNNGKLFNVDLMPQCANILKAQGNNIAKFDAGSIKQQVTEIFKIFQPLEFPGFPEFKPKIPNYWSILTNAVVNRTLASMPKTYQDAMAEYTEAAGKATGGASSGGQDYGSGEF